MKKKNYTQTVAVAVVCVFMLSVSGATAYRGADFHCLPPFVTMEEKPSVTVVLDTSASMLQRAYSGPFNAARQYYGYFDPDSYYAYIDEADNAHFSPDNATGQWSGNFLNWAAMLRIDVARKLLSGGKFVPTDNCYEMEHGHGTDGFEYDDSTPQRDQGGQLSFMTPLRGLVTCRLVDGENAMIVSGEDFGRQYVLRVKGEAESGLLQAIGQKARMALFTIEDGGNLRHPMSDDEVELARIVSTVNSVRPQGEAPLAATLYAVHEYLGQGGRQASQTDDPFYFPSKGQTVPCSRQSVILVSAGESSGDNGVPGKFKNLATIKRPETEYSLHSSGSTYLIDMAYFGHTTDLRPEDGMEGTQNADFYAVSVNDGPSNLLLDAARHGKFRDMNGNNLPDMHEEFDADGDGLPDNYYTAQAGRRLEQAITRVLLLDAPKITSGTAMTVTTLSRTGEGAAYQALFFPPGRTDRLAPPWSGQVHAFLLDAKGNFREDTNANQRLDLIADRIVEFAKGEIYVHVDADGSGVIEEEEKNATALNSIADIRFLWSTSAWLNSLTDQQAVTQRSSYGVADPNRYILTFVDKNQDMVASNGEIQHFALPANPAGNTLNSPDFFYNFLTLFESGSGTLGLDLADPMQGAINALREDNSSAFSNFQSALAKRQVDFIRGAEVGNATIEGIGDVTRSRTHEGTPWRLGDIVFSSPTVIGKPAENYHLIYNDTTYERFLTKYLDRRQVVYVGANDGMLHAFNGGFWNATTRTFEDERDGMTKFTLGQELWAYVPYNLLPHLRWLMHPDYEKDLHVAYMDLTPRVFDARIFVMSDGVTSIDEARYPGGWGTILVAGMRMGGAVMEVDINKTDGDAFKKGLDRTVSSAYVIMDVTDPESAPNVLAEISLPGQGFTTCLPAVMPMSSPNAQNANENKWYLVFGSGPADAAGRADRSTLMRGKSDQPGKLFVLDLSALYVEKTVKTIDSTGLVSSEGDAFAFAEAGSFVSEPVCVDLDIPSKSEAEKFSTDLVYFGTVAGDSASPAGKVYRLRTGNGPPEDWQLSILVDVAEPVSAAPAVAVDEKGSLWVYFGTGRFFNRDDILQPASMGFYGIREPQTAGTRNWDTVFTAFLFDSSKVAVTRGTCGEGKFSENCVGIIQAEESSNATRDWAWLTSTLDQAPGWKHAFSTPGERVLGQAAVLGGTVVFTSVIPAQEVCAAGGSSRLWSLYYKTGTPYFWPSLDHSGGNFPAFIDLGPTMAAHPTLHIGENPNIKAITQSNTGDLKATQVTSPQPFKSGGLFWRKNMN
ncbi:pilus assembly protein [Desulfomicrobium salsuginis]